MKLLCYEVILFLCFLVTKMQVVRRGRSGREATAHNLFINCERSELSLGQKGGLRY